MIDKIHVTLHARDYYNRANDIYTHPDRYDAIERAWSVWALSKLSFASQLGGSFGFDLYGTTAKKVCNAKDSFSEMLCRRLDRVTIENDNALKVISRYDRSDAFHFIDSPYIDSDCGHYAGTFNDDNLRALLDLLTTIRGRFMLTMFPNDMIDDYATSHDWTIHRIIRTISAAKSTTNRLPSSSASSARRKQEEWIVCNYPAPQQQLRLF